MKKIALLVPNGDVMPDAVVGSYFLLTQANLFLQQSGKKPVFEIQILGYKKQSLLYDGSFSVKTTHFKKVETVFDLLIVPGFTCEMEAPILENNGLIAWMKKQHVEHGTELASMCTGAFLVAATGLLDGKKCTSHWAFEQSFRRLFPKVNFLPEHIVTDDNGIYASGGAYSSLNLILYLIEKFCGKDTARWASKVFQLDIDRKSQKPFVIFNLQKAHVDEPVADAQSYIEKHFSEPLTVNGLADRFAFSRRNFVRRFKDATGNTPIEYIQRVRIEAAKRLLETTPKNINEVLYETGYSDNKSFRMVFKKITGYSPSDYRNRYGHG
ncbi:MAG: helix-turn-helix domain-containing protein [Saprospiraceae bacterium]|nr:helix-turn-helix domain-containing protein [Saprospiraceae bacterium]